MRHRKPEHFQINKLKRTYNHTTDTFNFNIQYETAPTTITQRTKEIAEAFGLGIDQTQKFTIYDNITLKIHPTDIVLITGDSGSGKSTLLKAIKTDLANEAQDTHDININPDQPIIETLGNNTKEAIELLSQTGLNDAFIFLRTYQELSDGQKHRYQIARLAASKKQWWITDEFCSTLDRDTAKIVAYNLQKQARKQNAAVIAATTHTDIAKDLAPNLHIHKKFGKQITTTYHPNAKATECSLTKQMRIEEGTYADYKTLSPFHYRSSHCPPPRKIFTLKRKSELCGVIVYSYPPPFCFGRNKIWKGTHQQLQHDISTISRIIIHPKYRSTGLGTKLVHETLPKAPTPIIETTAVMAKYNPFFEKAGMQKTAQTTPNKHITNAIAQLENLGFDPNLLASTNYTSQKLQNPNNRQAAINILTELSRKNAIPRRALITAPTAFPTHKTFTTKLHTQNPPELAQTLKHLTITNQTKTYITWQQKNGPSRI